MVLRVLDDMEERASAAARALTGPNVRLRALSVAAAARRDEDAMSLAILAAAAEDPTLLDPVRQALAGWFAAVREEAGDEQLALLVMLAFEGLRFLEILDLSPLDAATTRSFRERMLEFAAEAV
jgi:hypothetical protein